MDDITARAAFPPPKDIIMSLFTNLNTTEWRVNPLDDNIVIELLSQHTPIFHRPSRADLDVIGVR